LYCYSDKILLLCDPVALFTFGLNGFGIYEISYTLFTDFGNSLPNTLCWKYLISDGSGKSFLNC